MFDRIRRAWRARKHPPAALPAALLVKIPPRIEVCWTGATQCSHWGIQIDWYNARGRLTESRILFRRVELRAGPNYRDTGLSTWLPNATIEVTVGVSE